MRGFQPGKARAVPQNYADGGVVSTIKGMLGFGGGKKKPLPADLSKMPPTGAGPAASQPEPPKKAISQYSGMSALERRMKEQGLADGGLVKGPGTGISDEIEDDVEEGTFIMPADSTEAMGKETMEKLGNAKVPVNLSNGEAKLPPEALQAIGAEVMEAIKNVTHTPAAVQAKGFPGAQESAATRNFADGGVVRKEERPRTVADLARSPGYGAGAGGPVATPPAQAQAQPKPAPAPVAPPAATQPVPGVTRQGNSYTATTVADRAQSPAFGFGAAKVDTSGMTPIPTAPAARPATQISGVQRDGNSFSAAPAQPRQPSPYVQAAIQSARSTPADRVRTAGVSTGAGGPVTTTPTVQAPVQAPAAPAAPQTGGASGSWQSKPQAQSLAPSVAPRSDRDMPAPAPERSSMLGEFFRDGASEIAAQANAGNLAGAFGTATRKTLQAPGMTVLAAAAPALNAAGRMWDGLVGNSAAQPAPAVVPAASAKPPAAATTTTPPAAPAATDAAQNPAQKPEQKPVDQQGQAPNPNGREVLPGVYRQGSNSYTNIPGGNTAGGSTGQPNAQNMAAADALVARDRGFAPSQPADVMGIYSRASEALKGIADAQRALDEYGPRMSGGGDLLKGGRASQQQFEQDMLRTQLIKQAGQGGRGAAAAMQALNAMDANQNGLQVAQMREQGDTARFNAREQGETARAGMRESGENARSGRRDALAAELGRGQLDLQRTAQGFTTRQAERQERLYAEYESAKTPEEQSAVARKIAALAGKTTDPKDNFMVVGGGQEWDDTAGAMRNVPQRLVDLRTGQEVGPRGQQASLPPGMVKQIGTSNGNPVYEDAQGKRHILG